MLDQLIEALDKQLTPETATTITGQIIQKAKAGDGYALLALAILSSGSGRNQGKRPKGEETPILTAKGELGCRKCSGPIWDNRERIAKGEFSAKSPTFACRDKNCKWATWSKSVTTTPEPQAAAPSPETPGQLPFDVDENLGRDEKMERCRRLSTWLKRAGLPVAITADQLAKMTNAQLEKQAGTDRSRLLTRIQELEKIRLKQKGIPIDPWNETCGWDMARICKTAESLHKEFGLEK